MPSTPVALRGLAAALLTLVLLWAGGCAPPGPDTEAIEANNRGVGLMGRFDYDAAREVFAPLVERYPDWRPARVNLAIATLNRQAEGDTRAALGMVDEVLAEDPDHLRAHYIAGLLRLYQASPGAAEPHFRAVVEGDPDDAYAAYYLGQCLAQQGEHQQALDRYRRAMELDPYLRSAYYGAFQASRQLGRVDAARQLAQSYQRLGDNPQARLAEFKYTRMGPKAEARAVDREPPPRPEVPDGPTFTDPVPLTGVDQPLGSVRAPASITAADMNADGGLDLFLAGAGRGDAANLLLKGEPEGRFSARPEHPLARVQGVSAALWGDYDNDGLVDVYLCRNGPNQLWRQTAQGTWKDVTAATDTANGDHHSVDGALFDADHDGDLDIFVVNADGPDELLNNDRDGGFRPIAADQGIAGGDRGSRAVLPTDLDGDRDADIVVVHTEPPHAVYINDRLWRYRAFDGLQGLRQKALLALLAADRDADGLAELYAVDGAGDLQRWRRKRDGSYQGSQLTRLGSEPGWAQLAVSDVQGDGRQELLVVTPGGWQAVDGEGQAVFAAERPLRAAAPLLLDPASGAGLVALDRDRRLLWWGPGAGRGRFVALELSGRQDRAASMRSNASGIGTEAGVRVDSRWTRIQTYRRLSGPGQALQPVAVGLDGWSAADFVAIDWSDGVYQSEVDLAAGELHSITETQRQLSSCPVLFAWDSQGYGFVTDFLGVGGIGYAVGPGEYAEPRPWENLLLPSEALVPRDGRYQLKAAEPMEEVAYLDALQLVAFDLPPGWDMVLDERMAVRGPEPTGEPRFYREERLPARVVNDRGQTVTGVLREVDREAAPVGALDHRFIGRLAHEHVLTLAFADAIDQGPGEPMLVADGWVEYPYSQTMFAAWQAGAAYEAPTIEARGGDGSWQTLLPELGYPAGMPRRMSVPLEDLPEGTDALRIRSNMEVYWDRLAVAYAEPLPGARRRELPLLEARVAKTGFARRTTGDQRLPHYDYEERAPFWDTRYPAGRYTRFGPARALVAEVDDAVAIIGPGEELHAAFQAVQDPVQPGWSRRLVLETDGWAKDMDLYTRDGETVGPLPARGRVDPVRDRLHSQYNTRYRAGR